MINIAIKNSWRIRWFSWHRRLGIVTCFGILLWGLSGVTHPIMSRLQPKPVAFMPPLPAIALQASMFPNDVLKAHHIDAFQRLAVVSYQGAAFFRIAQSAFKPARYFAASDAQELPNGDMHYANMLASHYTGLPQSAIRSTRFITAFSDDYHAVNRLLPVWRVEFNGPGHLRAYIDTDQARLSSLADDTKYVLTTIFRWGHNWSFLDAMPRLQLTVMALVISVALFSTCSGLYLGISRQRSLHLRRAMHLQSPAQRWHRRLGLAVAISTLMFAASGLAHLLVSYQQSKHASPALYPITLSRQLSAQTWHLVMHSPLRRLDLVSAHGTPYWLVQMVGNKAQVAVLAQEQGHHHSITKGPSPVQDMPLLVNASAPDASPKNILMLSSEQAAQYAQRPLSDVQASAMVTAFGGEYGFVFKRLPVVRVELKGAGHPRYFIEPATGALAAKVEDGDALEGWIFAYIHKWNFADANKNFRDILVSLFALANVAAALLGLYLFTRRQSRR